MPECRCTKTYPKLNMELLKLVTCPNELSGTHISFRGG